MRVHQLLLLAALGGMAGCLTLKARPPEVNEYRLDYPSPTVTAAPLPAILRIAPFGAAAAYDRAAIVYRDDDYRTGTYYYERWMAHPASMIADLLARDLTASGLYRAVQQGASTVSSDYELSGQIEEIEERIGTNGRTAHLQLRVLLARTRARHSSLVAFQRTYSAEEPFSGDNCDHLAAAMSRALESISTRLQRDVHDAIARDHLP